MKFIVGPNPGDFKMLDKNGVDLAQDLMVSEFRMSILPGEHPVAEITIEVFGDEHEIEVHGENIIATLKANEIEKIDKTETEKEVTLADFHPD